MIENGAAPAAGDEASGGNTATVAAPAGGGPAPRAQPVHDQVRGEATQGRGRDGKFQPKPDDGPKVMDRGMFKEAATAASRKFMGKSTDDAALDAVKPTGKDPGATQDRSQPDKGTPATGKDGPAATTEERAAELEKARTHLKLDRWTDARLAKLTEAQILDFGKEAQEEHAAKYREGREAAAAKEQPPKAKTGGAQADDTAAEFEALAKEHFADFEDEGGAFGKSIAGFGRAIEARMNAQVEKLVKSAESEVAESLKEIHRRLGDSLQFELGTRDLKDSFPSITTPDGRKSLAARYDALRKADDKLDPRTALEQAADSLWGAERRRADAERKERITAARQGAHSDPTSMAEAPKPVTFHDVAGGAVRKHMMGG